MLKKTLKQSSFILWFFCAGAYANTIEHMRLETCDAGYEQWSDRITTTCHFDETTIYCTRVIFNDHFGGQPCLWTGGTFQHSLPTGSAVLTNIWWEFPGVHLCGSSTVGEMCWTIYESFNHEMLLYSPADTDGDQVADIADDFPANNQEWLDTDSDGIGNNADWDDDNDGVPDVVDAEPLNAGNSSEIDLPLDSGYKGNSTHKSTLEQ